MGIIYEFSVNEQELSAICRIRENAVETVQREVPRMKAATDIGIDLGTATILVYVKGQGVVLREPSVVAIEKDSRKIIAIGSEAQRMVGRTPGNILAIRPLRDGVIADYAVTEAMLKYFIRKVSGHRALFKPRVIVCAPSGVNSVEKKAILDAAGQVGARRTEIIEEPLAAALGAGLDICQPTGHMIMDIGGGTTDAAVISLGGTVVSESLRVGGNRMDEAIIRHLRMEHNLLIGERTAEDVKIQAGSAVPGLRQISYELRGRDLVSGLPKTLTITSDEICLALQEPLEAMVRVVKSVMEKTPPELAGDISEKGLVMTGGGSLLFGLDVLLSKETGVTAVVTEDPVSCVALGIGQALEKFPAIYSQYVMLPTFS
jgi:rod shape-determining protein MreB and related proteins